MSKSFGRRIRNVIAEFRGLPMETSHAYLKKPRTIGEVLRAQVKRLGWQRVRPEHVIQENWKEIIPSSLAHYCSPVKILHSDTLVMRCVNSTVMSELQMRIPEILRNLQTFPHCEKISRIRLITH